MDKEYVVDPGNASMKKSSKAVLLSALVFPGAGHLYLKRYFSGFILMGLSLAGILYIISVTVDRAFQIVDKIQSGAIPPDVDAITQALALQSGGAGTDLLNAATMLIVLCWIVGIVDSYRVGRLR